MQKFPAKHGPLNCQRPHSPISISWVGEIYSFSSVSVSCSAPEILHKGSCASASDLYSLGMVFIASFTGGQAVIQASHSTNNYFKLAGQVQCIYIALQISSCV